MVSQTLTAKYIATCFVDYLSEQYNKNNQYLAIAPADRKYYSCMEDLINVLVDDVELLGINVWEFSKESIRKVITMALQDYKLENITYDLIEKDKYPCVYVLLEVTIN